ncbi:MAG: Stk1 family PASTA domain-containing Ser/Thr kinase, partial [Clostridia bacterium]|nr:Stk1 family PASTA domain-containing Ser/Thr kinase [Clostridia bacterium]
EEFISNEEFLRRFKNESKAIAMLSHPNIVKVYDVSFGDLIQYIVMEYIDGITLKEYIEQQGSLRWKDAVHFTLQILKGLQHAHDKGIVHRDVKPQNIMVLKDGTIKVTDFGIARFARSEQRTITDKAIGSVHYISPEQARGEKTDEKADIYSVGVMLYEMLTGQLPFQAESAVSVAIMQLQRDPKLPTEINGSIPLGLEQITMHAMQKNPERRYRTASEMLCDLDQFRKDPSATFGYTYFVDNSPTRFIGGEAPVKKAPAKPDEEINEKSNMIPILAGIAAALVVAIVVFSIMFVPKFFSNTGSEIECPDFVGSLFEDVKSDEKYKDFKFNEEWEYNADYDFGYIFDQSETAGEKLKSGAEITLYVSMGQSTKQVPDVYGKTESAAVSELKSNGFKTVITEAKSEDVEKGLVIKTEPARTTVVAEGTEITVYVSTGKAVKNVDVPHVVGLKQEDAKKSIESKGLVVEVKEKDISQGETEYPKGYVMSQDPAFGSSQVPEGTTVVIFVSTGKIQKTEYTFDVTVPLPSDYAYDTGMVSLWENGRMLVESEKISINEAGEYTFEGIKTTDTSKTLVVELTNDGDKYGKYIMIKVDCKTGKWSKVSMTSNYEKKDTELNNTNE